MNLVLLQAECFVLESLDYADTMLISLIDKFDFGSKTWNHWNIDFCKKLGRQKNIPKLL